LILVVAAIIKKQNKYLIAKRASHMAHGGRWEFPGGKSEEGESPEIALERELFEELNIKTQIGPYIMSVTHDYENFKIELMAYEATHLSGDFTLSEHDEIAWVTAAQMKAYHMSEADLSIINHLMLK
jgi:8-oxo-dGTP diphosphatase